MKTSKCGQMKCAFNQMGMGCQACETCGATPYDINDNCDVCWNCQGDEGVLRWDNQTQDEKLKEAEKENELKPMVNYIQ